MPDDFPFVSQSEHAGGTIGSQLNERRGPIGRRCLLPRDGSVELLDDPRLPPTWRRDIDDQRRRSLTGYLPETVREALNLGPPIRAYEHLPHPSGDGRASF